MHDVLVIFDSTGLGMENKNYYGRGYIQLSWDYNYKAASIFLFGDEKLIENPDIGKNEFSYQKKLLFDSIKSKFFKKIISSFSVASNDDVAWSTAFWFWKKNVIEGEYGDSVLNENFGAATRAINGALECSGSYQYIAKKRFEIYKKVLVAFNIKNDAKENGCYN